MVVEGVNFNEALIKEISKCEFVEVCVNVFFQDRSEQDRITLLSLIYDRITQQ